MFLLQATNTSGISSVLFLGTLGMLVLTIGLIMFIIFHQRKVIRYQMRLQQMEQEQQQILLKASIHLQEEERQRIAADLHDDAGPLLATARLYLNENLVNQDKGTQLQSIFRRDGRCGGVRKPRGGVQCHQSRHRGITVKYQWHGSGAQLEFVLYQSRRKKDLRQMAAYSFRRLSSYCRESPAAR